MNLTVNKIKNRIELVSTRVSSIMIPIFQYVPATAIWRGIMSVPFFTYLALFFQNPGILKYDLQFLFRTHGIYITFFGFIFFIYSLVYQLTHRKQLIRKGPYKYVRHPQYLAFIIMTFGLTSIAFQTNPIFNFEPYYISGYTIIFYIWIAEVLAYVILGKIEDIALKAKYGDEFLEYVNNVPFMLPSIKLKRKKTEMNKSLRKINYFYMLKSLIIIFSLILLLVILIQIIDLYEEPTFSRKASVVSIIIFLLVTTILLVFTLTALTINEYRSYIIRRSYIQKGNSYLDLPDIFENENRLNIINQILRNPGIHHNELLRKCELQKGQFQWHLDVLLKYNIIKKEKYGQYTIYFPITTSFDANEYLENLIAKSKTSSKILTIIKENPGINSSEISRILNLSRNTVKYHVDKLFEENLINLERKGRKIELYPN